MSSQPLPPGGLRFTVSLLGLKLTFRRYPIDVPPPEGLLGFVNNSSRQTPATFRDGVWRNLSGQPVTWKPSHWTVQEVEP